MVGWKCIKCGVKANSKCVDQRSVFLKTSGNRIETMLLRLSVDIEWSEKKPEKGATIRITGLKDTEDLNDRLRLLVQHGSHVKELACSHVYGLLDEKDCELKCGGHYIWQPDTPERDRSPKNELESAADHPNHKNKSSSP